MLNLPSPSAQLPLDLALLAAPEALPGIVPFGPEAVVRADFDDLLAASAQPLPQPLPQPLLLPTEPVPAGEAPAAPAQRAEDAPQDPLSSDAAAIAQPWALVLVPELASLPAELVPSAPSAPPALPLSDAPIDIVPEAAAGGDTLGRGVRATGANGLWPARANSRPGLAVTLPPADPARPRGWQVALPAVAAPVAQPAGTPPPFADTPFADTPAAAPILRTITGEPVPYPVADLPPANSEPTRAQPLRVDPAQNPPGRGDPIPVQQASASAAQTVLPVRPPSAPAPAALAPVAVTPAAILPQIVVDPAQLVPPPVVAGVESVVREQAGPAAPRAGTVRRAASPEPALLAEPAVPAISLPSLPLAAPSSAPPSTAAPSATTAAATPDPAPDPAADPALSIASDRLGDIAVRLSGSPDQLQVAMQAQPAAAALIGADAPRLSQDLAAAGVALAGLSVNGQRADLGGGGRDRQRQSTRRDDDTPIAAVRRLAARSALNRTTTVDRFA